MQEHAAQDLRDLQAQIDRCRACQHFAPGFSKPESMTRNPPSSIVVVGVAPGSQELSHGRPFAGEAGKRLRKWLARAGLDPDKVYATSLLKCATSAPTGRNLTRMWVNCGRFFMRQMDIIRPRLAITLGRDPLRLLFGDRRALESLVGRLYVGTSLAYDLFPLFDPACVILPLPHPSPRSTWLQKDARIALLDRAIQRLTKEVSEL